MSRISKVQTYGQSYSEVSNNKLDEETKALYSKVEVAHSKDENGNVLDKLCLVFHRKAGGVNFGQLDRNSKLTAGQEVDINSISEKELNNGQQSIWRYDGTAL